jgi:RimJ/RimL family protein N-acetyltransferase
MTTTSAPSFLVTDRLVLRPWVLSDAPALTTLQNDNFEHLRHFMHWSDRFYNIAEMEERIEAWAGFWARGTHHLWGLFDRETGFPVGEVGLHPRAGLVYIHDPPCMLSYWVGREYEGRGLASEAVRGILAITVSRPLYAYIASENDRSVRLIQGLGFRQTGKKVEFNVFRLD